MKLICKEIKNTKEAKDFVNSCENAFTENLTLAMKNALELGNNIITLAGPTCSGKTTTASILLNEIKKAGKRAVVISIDDFYLDDLRINSNGEKTDFDSIKTIDLDYLSEVIDRIFSMKTVDLPIFNFLTGRRDGYRTLVPTIDDIYIFEGIQAVYPEIVKLFNDRYTSIFISVNDDVMFNGVYFAAHEIRLMRRLVRDFLFRNTLPEKTLEYWESVRENEEENIFPNSDNPHISIDSFLLYELFIIAPMAFEMLNNIQESSHYFSVAKGLTIRLEKIICKHFDNSFVPENSMFREFIG